MPITTDIQKLEPGRLIELYELDAQALGAEILYFHGYPQAGSITWQGNVYEPWSITAEGFSRTSQGQQAAPTLTVGNIGMDEDGKPIQGIISSLCLQFQDLVGARLTRRRTLSKYLDAVNFPDGNPDADPTEELPPEIWTIEQKTNEEPQAVTFVMSSAIDFDGLQLPGRQIVASICPWLWKGGYRGPYCNYTGNAYFDREDNPVADPSLDRCGGRVNSCKIRFAAEQGVSDPDAAVLNYGGFSSSDRIR